MGLCEGYTEMCPFFEEDDNICVLDIRVLPTLFCYDFSGLERRSSDPKSMKECQGVNLISCGLSLLFLLNIVI